MPSKNIVRQFDTDSYYHIYNRGVEKRKVFLDSQDYTVFLSLLKRHLDNEPHRDKSGRVYKQYKDVELLAFCLMPNHFHLLVYQGEDTQAYGRLLHSVSTAYTMYFNRRHKRVGYLFQGKFKAVKIDKEDYLQHISRYIHMNPKDYTKYEWSSLPYYLENRQTGWLQPQRIMGLFGDSSKEYKEFMADYEGQKIILEEIKSQLAGF